jgi:hypothetical protein
MIAGSLSASMQFPARDEVPIANNVAARTRLPSASDPNRRHFGTLPRAATLASCAARELDPLQAGSTPAGRHIHDPTMDMALVALLQQRLMEQNNFLRRILITNNEASGFDFALTAVMLGTQPINRRQRSEPPTDDRNTDWILWNDHWSRGF